MMEYTFSNRISALQPSAIREILKFTSDPTVISFAAGNPAAESFPIDAIREIAADILQNRPVEALQYSVTEGYTPLRTQLKARLHEKYAIGRDFDELLITTGAQQCMDLATKVLCNEGDTVICEDPSFIGSLNAFRSYGVRLKGVPLQEDGMDLDALEAALKTEKNVRFLYVIPNFQNPMGVCTSFEKRRAIYELARRYDALIVEDNPYGDLRFSGEDIPAIKTLDEDGRVIYCGSFSKILSAGMRLAYVSAPSPVIAKMTVAKQVSDVHTNIFFQLLTDEYLRRYDLDAHIAAIRKIYAHKAKLMLDAIDAHFAPGVTHTTPQGGLFLWCTLPDGVDMPQFCRTAVENKVAVVPGTAFLCDESGSSQSFRMNYSTPSDDAILRGVEILGGLTRQL